MIRPKKEDDEEWEGVARVRVSWRRLRKTREGRRTRRKDHHEMHNPFASSIGATGGKRLDAKSAKALDTVGKTRVHLRYLIVTVLA